jgi:hypothetical protein
MKNSKLSRTLCAAAAAALAVGSIGWLSSAHALGEAPVDKSVMINRCSIKMEENALRCKEALAQQLEECLEQAQDHLDEQKCDYTADTGLRNCQLAESNGDQQCWVNPNVPKQ